MESLPLTSKGAERLREELKNLKQVARPKVTGHGWADCFWCNGRIV
jgi:hypothetical protein